MDLDMDMDLRWGDLHAPNKRYSNYGDIHNVFHNLNNAPLNQYQRTVVLKNGIYIERGIRKKYGNKTSFIDKIKRYFNPYIDKAFGCLKQRISPPSGEVIEDVTKSYVLNTTEDDFEYFDDTLKAYYSDEPDTVYAVCYSLKRSPVQDLKESAVILRQSYLKDSINKLVRKDIGSGVTHLMMTSEGEKKTSRALEEAYKTSKFACKNIPFDSYWLVSPVSYNIMLKDHIWYDCLRKRELYKIIKAIASLDHKLDYWDKKHLNGYVGAGKVLDNFGKFARDNYDSPKNMEFMLDMTKIYPEKADEIAEDIYEELSHKKLNYLSFEKKAEAIVQSHM